MPLSNRLAEVRRPIARSGRKPWSFAIDPLESRLLLSAAISGTIPAVSAAQNSPPTTIDLNSYFKDPTVTGTAVVFHTTQGDIPLTLFDSKTPLTVANFLNYVNSDEYDQTVIQRVIAGFVLQGGQYLADGTAIAAGSPVASEAGVSNNTGTIAMALTSGGPGSATDAWFINLANNTELNGAADGGPFTVFGQVIYGGMSVVDQIVSLPQGTGPFPVVQGDPVGGTVPLQNYSGGTPSAANYVTLPSVQVVPALAYTVTSSNNALVTPSVSNGTLTLNYAAGQAGSATLSITATDLGGNSVSSTFKVTIGSVLGKGSANSIRFVDGDGTNTTLTLAGVGEANVQFSGSNVVQTLSKSKVLTVTGSNVFISSIDITGANSGTTLNINGSGGDGLVEIGALTSDSDMRAVNATRGSLTGALTINGSLGKLALADAASGAITVIGTSGSLTLNIASASSEAVNSSEAISSIHATSWEGNGSGTPATISAPSIGRIAVNQDFVANLSTPKIGPITAGSITGGTWSVSTSITNISAASITGLNLVAGAVQRIASRGAITDTDLSAAALKSATAGSITSGTWNLTGSGLSISSGTITGLGLTAGAIQRLASRGAIASSNLTASSIQSLTAGSITSGNWNVSGAVANLNAGSITGLTFAAASIQHLTSRGAIDQSHLTSGGNVAAISALGLTDSSIIAGTATLDTHGIPTAFATSATIGSVTLRGAGFSNSVIGAESLGRLNLGAIASANNGAPFGVAANNIVSFAAVIDGKHFALRNPASQGDVTTALTSADITPNDLVIRIV